MSATPPSTDPSRTRTGLRRGLVEQEIFEQATLLFAERGFAGTSFQDVADAVGLTRPALYHYVKSKEDLLARLVAELTEDPAAFIDDTGRRPGLDSPARLREIVTSLARRQAEHATRFRLIIRSEADLPEPVASLYAESRRAVLRSLTAVIANGVADGSFRAVDPRIAALGILGTVNWIPWWHRPGSADDLDAVSAQFAETAVAGLVATTAPSAGAAATPDGPRAALAAVRADLDRLEATLDQSRP
jgi:AcrR family transcriptional regulator